MKPKNNQNKSGFIICVFFLANFRGTVFSDLLRRGFQITYLPWLEILIWAMLMAVVIRNLLRDGLLEHYILIWKFFYVSINFKRSPHASQA